MTRVRSTRPDWSNGTISTWAYRLAVSQAGRRPFGGEDQLLRLGRAEEAHRFEICRQHRANSDVFWMWKSLGGGAAALDQGIADQERRILAAQRTGPIRTPSARALNASIGGAVLRAAKIDLTAVNRRKFAVG